MLFAWRISMRFIGKFILVSGDAGLEKKQDN